MAAARETGTGGGLVLAGPPGVGKTTVGQALSQRLHLPVIDLDQVVTENTGKHPADILGQQGEETFRALEVEALRSLAPKARILCLGGGTLTQRAARVEARKHGPLVGLTASLDTLKRRTEPDRTIRPLLTDMASLLDERKLSYASADIAMGAEKSPHQTAEDIAKATQDLRCLNTHFEGTPSRILVGRSLDGAILGAAAHLAPTRPVLLIMDAGVSKAQREQVEKLLRSQFSVCAVQLEGGEGVKSWSVVEAVLSQALEAGCGRQSAVVGLGGGAVCDVSNFIASLLGRGTPSVLVPTTLLAQVDASVGGKCAVNLAGQRNPVGAFHVPDSVIIDLDYLKTLPQEEFRSGMAELIKMAVLGDSALFAQLEAMRSLTPQMVFASVKLKSDIVEADPREHSVRKHLNLGHTLGHALESASQFGMRHGEAVAIGMAAAARVSVRRGALRPAECERIEAVLQNHGLPVAAPPALLDASARWFVHDKKGDNTSIAWVLLRRVGEAFFESQPIDLVRTSLIESGGYLTNGQN